MFCATVRPGLELRLLEERHAPTLFNLVDRERPYLREWLPWVDGTLAEDDSLAFIKASLEQFANNNGFAAGIWDTSGNADPRPPVGFASTDRDDGWGLTSEAGNQPHFAGVIGTHKINWANRKVELGYWIAREFQGNGIMTDACRVVVTHLLRELDLNRVEILCGTGNEKSCAIPRRLGFTLDGTLREGELCSGRYLDLHVFGMLKRDWHA
jgi:ribosomal-protein-serine acetyltransferase